MVDWTARLNSCDLGLSFSLQRKVTMSTACLLFAKICIEVAESISALI